MASYPTYTIAGVKCSDPSGRWDLLPGTDVLPSFPGRRVTNWTVPGMVGNRSAAYAPGEASIVTINMRFNAVAGTAGTFPKDRAGRLRAIRDNMETFFHATAVARSGYLGLVELRRYYSSSDYRKISARLVASAEPSWSAHADHATITFKFECPTGAWKSPSKSVTTAVIRSAKRSTKIKVPAGTAPATSNMIQIKGPLTSAYGNRLTITNGHGLGVKIGLPGVPVTIPTGKWLVINTDTWRCGISSKKNDWGCSKPYAGWIEPRGRPMGSAVTILPEVEKNIGWIHIWSPKASTEVTIRNDRMWY